MTDLETRLGAAVESKVGPTPDLDGLAARARSRHRLRRARTASLAAVAAIAVIALPAAILFGGHNSADPLPPAGPSISDGWKQVNLGHGITAAVPDTWQAGDPENWCADGLGGQRVGRVAESGGSYGAEHACTPRSSYGVTVTRVTHAGFALASPGSITGTDQPQATGPRRFPGVWRQGGCPANGYCDDPDFPVGSWIASVSTDDVRVTIATSSGELTTQIRNSVVLPDQAWTTVDADGVQFQVPSTWAEGDDSTWCPWPGKVSGCSTLGPSVTITPAGEASTDKPSGQVWWHNSECPPNASCIPPTAFSWLSVVYNDDVAVTIATDSEELTTRIRDTVVLGD